MYCAIGRNGVWPVASAGRAFGSASRAIARIRASTTDSISETLRPTLPAAAVRSIAGGMTNVLSPGDVWPWTGRAVQTAVEDEHAVMSDASAIAVSTGAIVDSCTGLVHSS